MLPFCFFLAKVHNTVNISKNIGGGGVGIVLRARETLKPLLVDPEKHTARHCGRRKISHPGEDEPNFDIFPGLRRARPAESCVTEDISSRSFGYQDPTAMCRLILTSQKRGWVCESRWEMKPPAVHGKPRSRSASGKQHNPQKPGDPRGGQILKQSRT